MRWETRPRLAGTTSKYSPRNGTIRRSEPPRRRGREPIGLQAAAEDGVPAAHRPLRRVQAHHVPGLADAGHLRAGSELAAGRAHLARPGPAATAW